MTNDLGINLDAVLQEATIAYGRSLVLAGKLAHAEMRIRELESELEKLKKKETP